MNQPTPYRDGVEPTAHLAVTTGNDVAGYKITNYLGVVRGIVVRSPGFGNAIVGGLKQLVGGNISEYVQVCEQARHEAYTHMVANAQALGAHANHRHAVRRDRVLGAGHRGAGVRDGGDGRATLIASESQGEWRLEYTRNPWAIRKRRRWRRTGASSRRPRGGCAKRVSSASAWPT